MKKIIILTAITLCFAHTQLLSQSESAHNKSLMILGESDLETSIPACVPVATVKAQLERAISIFDLAGQLKEEAQQSSRSNTIIQNALRKIFDAIKAGQGTPNRTATTNKLGNLIQTNFNTAKTFLGKAQATEILNKLQTTIMKLVQPCPRTESR